MTNIVLKSLRVKNFGPFANEVVFTTAIDRSKKEYIENTFSTENDVFNRISYIFGANGAGKSNFCKAIIQIQSFINLSPILASNNPQLMELQPVKLSANDMDRHFLFDLKSKSTPSEYAIEIVMDGITYNYSFAVYEGRIISEQLTKKRQRTEVILSRTSPAYNSISLKSELASFAPNVSVVKDRALCLSMAAFLNNPLASQLVMAINNIAVMNMANLNGLRNITQENFTEDIKQRCMRILRIAEPTMDDLDVSFTEEKVDARKASPYCLPKSLPLCDAPHSGHHKSGCECYPQRRACHPCVHISPRSAPNHARRRDCATRCARAPEYHWGVYMHGLKLQEKDSPRLRRGQHNEHWVHDPHYL